MEIKNIMNCLVCNENYRNLKLNDNQFERTCTGTNHSLLINTTNNKINFLKTSLDKNYSKFLIIDFIKNSSEIWLFKNSKKQHTIHLPNIPTLDFPNLTSLKDKIAVYMSFL